MKSELYIEANGEVHRVETLITWNVITVCEEVIPRAKVEKISNNLQGRKCRKCFNVAVPSTYPESVPKPNEVAQSNVEQQRRLPPPRSRGIRPS